MCHQDPIILYEWLHRAVDPVGEITLAQWLQIGVVSSKEPPYLASLASFAEN